MNSNSLTLKAKRLRSRNMTHETMTVHKALAELKIIDDRIRKAIDDCYYVRAVRSGTSKIDGVPTSTYTDMIKSGYQKANDLINRRNAIKRAVVLSNASTKVNIGGKEYTVAEAIDMKNNGMDYVRYLLSRMTQMYMIAKSKFNDNSGEEIERKANEYVAHILSSQGGNVDKTDAKQIQALHDSYIANNEFVMLDPLDVGKKIEELDDMIAKFETDVDAALSTSNAITTIEVEY